MMVRKMIMRLLSGGDALLKYEEGARSEIHPGTFVRVVELEDSVWCGRGDLNPHASRRHPLKMVCLPISPLPHLKLTSFQLLTEAVCEGQLPLHRILHRLCASVLPGQGTASHVFAWGDHNA